MRDKSRTLTSIVSLNKCFCPPPTAIVADNSHQDSSLFSYLSEGNWYHTAHKRREQEKTEPSTMDRARIDDEYCYGKAANKRRRNHPRSAQYMRARKSKFLVSVEAFSRPDGSLACPCS